MCWSRVSLTEKKRPAALRLAGPSRPGLKILHAHDPGEHYENTHSADATERPDNACTGIPGKRRARSERGLFPDGSAEALVLSIIDEARAEIRLAGYSFTSPEVATALIKAKARGVDVRLVLDEKVNQNRINQSAINLLAARDIPVRLNGQYAAMQGSVPAEGEMTP